MKQIVTTIGVRISIEGFHKWENAIPEVDFLKFKHRHTFIIDCEKKVENNDDRKMEFILTKRKVINYLYQRFGEICDFGNMSCETIAAVIRNDLNFDKVTVSEDGEFWARVEEEIVL